MATVAQRLTRLMQNVRIAVPGAPDDLIKLELYNALDEFFKDSNVWLNDVSIAVTPTGGVNSDGLTWSFDANDSGNISRLMYVLDPNSIQITASMQEPGTLVLKNAPSAATTYTTRVALTVLDPVDSNSFPQCPDWIVDKYALGLIDGVLGRLMSMPAKPFSNERLSIFHMRKFRNVISVAREEARRFNTYGAQNWQFPQTFRVQRKRSW